MVARSATAIGEALGMPADEVGAVLTANARRWLGLAS